MDADRREEHGRQEPQRHRLRLRLEPVVGLLGEDVAGDQHAGGECPDQEMRVQRFCENGKRQAEDDQQAEVRMLRR
ncbi:MAG: hypothetical protein RIB46_19470 [Pseudomonadales bacterium]